MNSFAIQGLTLLRHKMMAVAIMLLIMLLALGAAPRAMAATATAGTVIGNQATATYKDSANTDRTTSSNVVQTTVSQVKSFALNANGAKTAAPGQTVYYPHTITNTGNGTDTYALTTPVAGGTVPQTSLVYYIDANSDGVPDNFTPITSTGPLPAGSPFSFVVAGVVPSGATSGTTGTITVAASDTGGNSTPNTDTTTVANSVVNVNKALSVTSGATGNTVAVTLSYTNSGTLLASNLVLADTLPAGMTYKAGTGKWNSSTANLSDSGSGNPAGITYSVAGSTITATVATLAAGASGTLKFDVQIAATAPTTPTNAVATTNTASYKTDTQTILLYTNAVTYAVLQNATVVATPNSSSAVNGAPNAVVIASAGQGATLTFTDYVWNTGNGSDTFNLALSPSAAFPTGTTFAMFRSDGVTSLLDSNGDGVPDTGPLASGASFAVVIKAYLPSSAPAAAGPYTQRLSATSVFDPARSDTIDNTLSAISANSVDLSNGGGQGTGPGTATVIVTNSVMPNSTATTQTRFELWVNNTSPVADSYTLSLASTLPTGWTVTFAANCTAGTNAITSTGTIAAAGTQAVCAVVNVPATNTGNAAIGNYDFTFRSQSAVNATTVDSIVDRVTVLALHSLSLTPNGAQQTFPGGAVTYSHRMSNNGNGSESVSFPANFLTDSQAAAGWTSALYIDNNADNVLTIGTDTLVVLGASHPLAANDSVTLFVRVFAPGSATSTSPADVSTVTATYSSLTASANDTTTVTDGLLLLKEQKLIGCDGTGTNTYSNAAIAAGSSTAPGKCIGYRITATNTTAATINTVVVSDTVPANTTLNTGCGAPAQTGGTSVGGTATNGSTGTVTATAGTLASSASFQLTFCVQINP
jgi:uncharacterized repeat protein (TIGR01451 family)